MPPNMSDHLQYRRLVSVGRRLYARGNVNAAHKVSQLVRWRYSADLPLNMDLSNVCLMHNALGVAIHQAVEFRGRVVAFQHVTIGETGRVNGPGEPVAPSIGDRVFIGAGASIVGPIRVGDDCVIGAGAIVTRDVADGHRVVGNPGRAVELTDFSLLDYWF